MHAYPEIEKNEREKVEIFISCRSLTCQEEIQRRGVEVKMSLLDENKQMKDVFKTENIYGTPDPNYCKSYIMDYIFQINQQLTFEIEEAKGKILGQCTTTTGSIVGSKNSTIILPLVCQENQNVIGKIIIRAEKVQTCHDEINLQIEGKNIKDVRFWSKSSPFLVLSRTTESQEPLKVYQTEKIENNLNPKFKQINIKVQKLCNNDYFLPLIIQCFDYDSNGSHQFIGETQFSLDNILKQNVRQFVLKDHKQQEVGKILISHIEIISKPQFLDYVRGGIHLNLICAIDFTSSNLPPSMNNSLHALYMNGFLNSYQQAILSVGEILLAYDEDKLIPLYGFGAKPKLPHFNFSQTLHCFPLNGNPQDPNVFGIQGLMQAYAYFLNYVELAGPTLFNPLILQAKAVAEQSKLENRDDYYILLIITDGEIHDMESTISSIVSLSLLPLSIIIIGVGDADFSRMIILDGDMGLVDQTGKKALRDLVQFVPFNSFKNNPDNLASQVLEELPDQVVKYYELINQAPKEPNNYQRMQSIMPNMRNNSIVAKRMSISKEIFQNVPPNSQQGSQQQQFFPRKQSLQQKQQPLEMNYISNIPLAINSYNYPQNDDDKVDPNNFNSNSFSNASNADDNPFNEEEAPANYYPININVKKGFKQ